MFVKQTILLLLTSTFLISCGQSNLSGRHPDSEVNAEPFVSMCTSLSFEKVQWPAALVEPHRSAFSLALNVTGSFEAEGHAPVWGTITNDFDDQGMSLGLFQQNFGQGSLQPLLIEMLTKHLPMMQAIFSEEHLKSLTEMLLQFKNTRSLNDPTFSPLDVNENLSMMVVAKEQVGVEWARKNLYVNSAFIPQWKKEFTTMATTPAYISLQIKAAQTYHKKALEYFDELQFAQIRSYLMLVDIVVQNGALYNQDIIDYAEFLKHSPQSTEGNKLKALLELRLRHVRPKYVSDVRNRKTAIINGSGMVHGSSRLLEKEYCYNRLSTYR